MSLRLLSCIGKFYRKNQELEAENKRLKQIVQEANDRVAELNKVLNVSINKEFNKL